MTQKKLLCSFWFYAKFWNEPIVMLYNKIIRIEAEETSLGEAPDRWESHQKIISSLCSLNFHWDHVMGPLPQYTLTWVLSYMCIILLPVTGAKWSCAIFLKGKGPLSVRLSMTSTEPLWQLIFRVLPMSPKGCDNPEQAVPLHTLLSWKSFAVVKKSHLSNGRKHGAGPGCWLWASARVRVVVLCLSIGPVRSLPLQLNERWNLGCFVQAVAALASLSRDPPTPCPFKLRSEHPILAFTVL